MKSHQNGCLTTLGTRITPIDLLTWKGKGPNQRERTIGSKGVLTAEESLCQGRSSNLLI